MEPDQSYLIYGARGTPTLIKILALLASQLSSQEEGGLLPGSTVRATECGSTAMVHPTSVLHESEHYKYLVL